MKHYYVDKATRSISDLTDLGDGSWEINRINVPRSHRGQGIASRLLREICSDADREHATLHLQVAPSDGLNYAQLYDWYRRYGFESIDLKNYLMVRYPKDETKF